MRKLFLLFSISIAVTSQTAVAAMDSWTITFGHGNTQYILRDKEDRNRDRELRVICVTSIDSKESHHITLRQGNQKYSTLDRTQSLAFQINDGQKITPGNTTSWQNGANNWDTFIKELSYAEKINVFSKNKKIATYNRKLSRYQGSGGEMAICTYKADRYRYGTTRYYEAIELFRR